ncbi:hypothetical protein NFI96_001541 [Prochilodus magdalenae]|nr:hypothetical protein NFI96_001541 [Prochilodus magdalenae]
MVNVIVICDGDDENDSDGGDGDDDVDDGDDDDDDANRELTAVVSEIVMYVLIVFLQLWLIGVLVYCYKKIYAESEAREARKALRDTNKSSSKTASMLTAFSTSFVHFSSMNLASERVNQNEESDETHICLPTANFVSNVHSWNETAVMQVFPRSMAGAMEVVAALQLILLRNIKKEVLMNRNRTYTCRNIPAGANSTDQHVGQCMGLVYLVFPA